MLEAGASGFLPKGSCREIVRGQVTKFSPAPYPFSLALMPLCPCALTYYELRTMNYELAKMLSYPAQFNIMLKYKNVKFLQHFAQKVRAFAHFCQLSVIFLQLFASFCTIFSLPLLPKPPILPIDPCL